MEVEQFQGLLTAINNCPYPPPTPTAPTPTPPTLNPLPRKNTCGCTCLNQKFSKNSDKAFYPDVAVVVVEVVAVVGKVIGMASCFGTLHIRVNSL
jgi:hypothetical protein